MTQAGELERLQARFATALLEDAPGELDGVLAGEPARARRRLAIYRRAVLGNWCRALRAAYPVVERLVGEAWFDEAAAQYSLAGPPGNADLNRHGATFPRFLGAYPHAAGLPWLEDVARLEWARHESLAAADAPAWDVQALAGLTDEVREALVLRLHPAVRLVRSAWPVLAIWEANQPGRDGTAWREAGADDVLVWREANRAQLALLPAAQADLVEAILAGRTLGALARMAAGDALPEVLPRLARLGVLAGGAAAPAA